MAEAIACRLETMVNGRNTRPGFDLSGLPTSLQPFAVALLHKAGACSAYALPLYKQQLPLPRWLTVNQFIYITTHYSSEQLGYDFLPTYWDTAVEAIAHPYPACPPGLLSKALLSISADSLLVRCCLAGMTDLAAAAEQMGLAPAGTAAAATKAAVSASSGMGMLRRIWCNQLLRLRPHVLLNLLAAAQPLQLQLLQPAAVPMLAGSGCGEVAMSSGQGGAGSARTAVGADAEGSKAAEPAAVLPPSRRKQGGSRQRIGRQLQRLGGLVGRVLLRL
jgi:hypothetical protein